MERPLATGAAAIAATIALAVATVPSPAAAEGVRCGAGTRVCAGTPQRDDITGSRRADRIVARGGDDSVNAGRGDDVVEAGGGSDRVRGGPGGDVVHLGRADSDRRYPPLQEARGDRGDDTLVGGPDADRLRGDDGADLLVGKGGDDYLSSGLGADVLRGGPGDDLLETVESREDVPTFNVSELVLEGGAGDDLVVLRDDGSPDRVDCGDGTDEVIYRGTADATDVLTDCEATTVWP